MNISRLYDIPYLQVATKILKGSADILENASKACKIVAYSLNPECSDPKNFEPWNIVADDSSNSKELSQKELSKTEKLATEVFNVSLPISSQTNFPETLLSSLPPNTASSIEEELNTLDLNLQRNSPHEIYNEDETDQETSTVQDSKDYFDNSFPDFSLPVNYPDLDESNESPLTEEAIAKLIATVATEIEELVEDYSFSECLSENDLSI